MNFTWINGDVSASQTLSDLDHLYPDQINELRTNVNTLAALLPVSVPTIPTQPFITVGPVTGNYDYNDIQLAVNAAHTAGGATIRIAPGTYTISSAITVYDNIYIQGAGINTTIIKIANSANCMGFVGTSVSNAGFYDLTIDGNKINQPAGSIDGINITNGIRIYVSNIQVLNTTGPAFYFTNGQYCHFFKCETSFCANGYHMVNGGGHNTFVSCLSYRCDNGYFFNNSCTYNQLFGCTSIDAGYGLTDGFGFSFATSCNFSICVNCISVNSIREGFTINKSTNCQIIGCLVDGTQSDFGISIDVNGANCDFTRINGCVVRGTAYEGIAILGSRWGDISNNSIYNTMSNAGATNGAIFTSSSASFNKITGNVIIDDRTPKLHKYPIVETSGGNYNLMQGNIVEGYLTAGITKTGANSVVDADNIQSAS